MSARAARKTRLVGRRFGDLRFVGGCHSVPQNGKVFEHILDSRWTAWHELLHVNLLVLGLALWLQLLVFPLGFLRLMI